MRTASFDGVTRNPPDSDFPRGSATWNWESLAPVASYLVQSSIGNYSLSSHVGADGVTYYQAQDEGIPPAKRAHNAAILDQQEEVTNFESLFNGPYPFVSDGALVGLPSVAFEEEMQTMISFNEGVVELPVLWHENMHQWWGDNVSEASYEMTFFKEGLAEWMESYVFPARALKGGEFERALIATFDRAYANGGSFWTIAPSKPYAYTLFDGPPTYERPAAAYEALRRILEASRLRRRATGSPARLRRREHLRAPARGRLRTSAPEPESGLPRAPGAVLRRMVRHRLRARRRRAAPSDHRSRARRDELLRSRRRLSPPRLSCRPARPQARPRRPSWAAPNL